MSAEDAINAIEDTIDALPGFDPIDAFLWAIRKSEHSDSDVESGADFGTYYGGRRFVDFSNHPVLTGEMKGVPLSASTCVAAGFSPGCVSTAAGAFQINLPTWRDVNAWGPTLPDFTPESQTEAARRILDHDGISDYILAGEYENAIAMAGNRWASLPTSKAKQSRRSFEFVLDKFYEGLSRQGAA